MINMFMALTGLVITFLFNIFSSSKYVRYTFLV